MSLLYEKLVQEDLNIGTSAAITVTSPAGGSLTGTQIGIHTVAVGQTAWLGERLGCGHGAVHSLQPHGGRGGPRQRDSLRAGLQEPVML